MVFRSDDGKFKDLKRECDEFLGHVKFSKFLWSNIKTMNLQQILDQGCNWQVKLFRHEFSVELFIFLILAVIN